MVLAWNKAKSLSSVNHTTKQLIIIISSIIIRWYLPLFQKNSITHIHGLAVYVKERLPFARDLSLGFTSLSVLLLFPLSITFLVTMHGFWFYFMRFCWSAHLLMRLSLETLRSIIRKPTYPMGLIDLLNSIIIFLSQMTLRRWLILLLASLTLILTVLLFYIYFSFWR